MSLSKRERERLHSMCGQLNEDDAVDPRTYFRRRYHNRDSKVLRLCKQVADTLSLVLSGTCADEILQSLEIFSVQPAPNSGRLLVVVKPADDIRLDTTPERILEELHGVSGLLRTELAQATARRKTPNLVFQVLWPQHEGRQ